MNTARFRVYVSEGWIICIPKNDDAKAIIGGKMAVLRPGPRVPEPCAPFEFSKKVSKVKK